jgi:dethiobiotin synthetase
MHLFITGTDTDAGKTHVSTLLLQALTQLGLSAAGYKPVGSGGRSDAQQLLAASSPGATLDEVNPCWFPTPFSPFVAAQFANRPVVMEDLVAGYHALAARFPHLIVEGAGGWETPLAPGQTMAHLAQALQLPVLLVVNNRLGAQNHTLLTLRSIAAHGLTCVGIILNYPQDERDSASISNRSALEAFTNVPILAELMHGETELPAELVQTLRDLQS